MVLPVKFSFVEEKYLLWDAFEYFMDFCFFIDIILNFFSAYSIDNDDGEEIEIIVKHKAIICNYLKFWFWVDLSSVIPLQFVFSSGSLAIFLRFSKLPRLYKIAKISKLMRSVRASRKNDSIWVKVYNMVKLNPGIDRLFLNLFSIFIFCHLFACLWHFVARSSSEPNN